MNYHLETEESSFWRYFSNCWAWWCHQMETFSALMALCEGNSPVTGEFPSQRPVMRSFDVFFDLCLSKCLSKQSKCRWYEVPLLYVDLSYPNGTDWHSCLLEFPITAPFLHNALLWGSSKELLNEINFIWWAHGIPQYFKTDDKE